MSFEQFESSPERISLSEELKSSLTKYIDETYGGSDVAMLHEKYISAISEGKIEELLDLSEKIDLKLTYLRGKFPTEWQETKLMLDELLEWLDQVTK